MSEQVTKAAQVESSDTPNNRAMNSHRPRVVIVGAGFGGMSAARTLSNSEVDVLVLDRNNYHGFWPLLYQVATAGLEPESIAYPVRAMVRKFHNVQFQMAEVKGIDMEKCQVITDRDHISYDYLILSAGSANSYFGNDALAQHTLGLKDIEDAVKLRNNVLTAFEQVVREPDPERRAALMTFVVIGGGPTGVELAGAFAELIRHVMRKDYPMLDVAQARVILVEAMDKVLSTFPPHLQRKGQRQLEKMGVQVKLNAPVASVEDGLLTFKDGTQLNAGTVVWAAGVRSALLTDKLGIPTARQQRAKVTPTLHLPERPEVFIIGDMACLETYKNNQAYPMVAPVAIQQGKQAAQNLLAGLRGDEMKEFKYFDKGNMATIGRRAAVLDAFGIQLSGYLAWISWLFVHLVTLIGFRNRLVVLTNWAYNYFTYDRGARLITGRRQS